MSGSHMDENLPGLSQEVNLEENLEDVRKLELSYSHATPGKAKLSVEYVGGRLKVFEVDRYLIERLLEQLKDQGANSF
jgi:hypothetical protein